MARRKKWKPVGLPKLTPIAKEIWRAIYPEPWPKGWTVEWAGWMRGAMGLCVYGQRRIVLSYGDLYRKPQPKRIVLYDANDVMLLDAKPDGSVSALMAVSEDSFTTGDRCPLDTLTHEFIHMRCGKGLRHGQEFERLHKAAMTRAWAAFS